MTAGMRIAFVVIGSVLMGGAGTLFLFGFNLVKAALAGGVQR